MTDWLFADNVTGTTNCSAGAVTIAVSTVSGTWPVPSAGQQFQVSIDSGNVDNAELAIVTHNASGVFTLESVTQYAHNNASVKLTIPAAFLNTIVSNSQFSFFTNGSSLLTLLAAINGSGAVWSTLDNVIGNATGATVDTTDTDYLSLISPPGFVTFLTKDGIVWSTIPTGAQIQVQDSGLLEGGGNWLGVTSGAPAVININAAFFMLDVDGSFWVQNGNAGGAWVHVT